MESEVDKGWITNPSIVRLFKEIEADVDLQFCSSMEEASAAVGKVDVTRAEAEDASVNEKTVAEGKKKKRTKTVRVHQEFIDGILEEYPFRPFPGEPQELEKNIEDPEARERLRVMLAPVTAIVKEARDMEEAIIKQYLAQGYAEEEVEVSDDDDDDQA
ncbi:hypothetical protein HU200_054498 [Digitaria exilis]|uniref:Uncharacterized protein n=1 Tax=Digitaria exilis TaxID=1010633 RepID=A0A835E2K1_9POAL|nr:hypothetical protein HU200_054498 [Digitaria exilis]